MRLYDYAASGNCLKIRLLLSSTAASGSPSPTRSSGTSPLDAHLVARDWMVAGAPSIADLSLFAYVSVAPVAIPRAVARWLDRVRGLDGFLDDFVPYPGNARPGAGTSIY